MPEAEFLQLPGHDSSHERVTTGVRSQKSVFVAVFQRMCGSDQCSNKLQSFSDCTPMLPLSD